MGRKSEGAGHSAGAVGATVKLYPTPKELIGVKQEVRKHVATIHISGELGLLERKLVDVLLLNAYDNLMTERLHRIPVKLLMAFIGWGESEDTAHLKKALTRIASTPVEFNLMDQTETTANRWKVATLLAGADIKDGYCVYEYSSFLAEEMSNPDVYALVNVAIQRMFASGYGLNLYQNCLRFRNVGSTGVIPLAKVRKILGALAPTYDDTRRFNNLVLNKAVQEVNTVSDILIDPEFTREGRKIVGVKFVVKTNPQAGIFDDNQERIQEAKESETYARLRKLNIGHHLALSAVLSDEARAKHALEVVEQKLRTNQAIRSPGGYVRRLIEDPDFTPGESAIEVEMREAREAQKLATQKAAAQEQAKLLTASARRDRVVALINELTPHELRTITAEYVAGDGAKNSTSYNPATGKFMKLDERTTFKTWLIFYIGRKHGLRPDDAGTSDQPSSPASPTSSSEAAI